MSRPLSRRTFLGQASCAAISALPVLNTLLNLRLAGSVAAAEAIGDPNDYRALVCIFLNGGNDSFNMLVPRGPAEHAEYALVRQDLALPVDQLLPIHPIDDAGRQLGLHPGLPEIQALFEAGHAAFVANVGTLVEPTTKLTYGNGLARLPFGLFSHSDQTEQWQTSIPDQRSGVGWAGRMADLIHDLNTNQSVSMNISLAGSNIWQTGNSVFEYAISKDGATELDGYRKYFLPGETLTQLRSAAVDSQLAQDYANVLQRSFARSERSALDAYEQFASATNLSLPAGAAFPDSLLAEQLAMITRTVAGRGALGMSRQTFFVSVGGWDHHDDVLLNQGAMLPRVSAAIGAFYDALARLGLQNKVTLFIASDFGRTLTSNGRGSDHAWGGHSLVVGGAVNGRRIYGQYPDLYPDSPLDVGRGRLIPTTSVDAYFAELALWLGVSKQNLPLVLPNIARFYDLAGSAPPLGFLSV